MSGEITNLSKKPITGFEAQEEDDDDNDKTFQKDDIHIRIQQRNGRKTLTTIQGLSDDFDLKKIIKVAKKEYHCNGNVVDHPEWGQVIQLQGDHRTRMQEFLTTTTGIARKDQVKVHGF